MKLLYINKQKPRAVVSNLTHKEYLIFEAHEEKKGNMETYVSMDDYKKLQTELEVLRKRLQYG